MFSRLHRSSHIAVAISAMCGAILPGCGGSSASSGSLTPQGSPATPTPTPTSVTVSVILPTAGGSIALPAIGGYSAMFQIAPGAPDGITLTATETTIAPQNAPFVTATRRRPLAGGPSSVFFIILSTTGTTPGQYFAGLSLSLRSPLPNGAMFEDQLSDITSSNNDYRGRFGPSTGANPTQFNFGVLHPTMQPGHAYLHQFFYATDCQC